jgi:hypothetical protein
MMIITETKLVASEKDKHQPLYNSLVERQLKINLENIF